MCFTLEMFFAVKSASFFINLFLLIFMDVPEIVKCNV